MPHRKHRITLTLSPLAMPSSSVSFASQKSEYFPTDDPFLSRISNLSVLRSRIRVMGSSGEHRWCFGRGGAGVRADGPTGFAAGSASKDVSPHESSSLRYAASPE